jgi:hypothetical protein
MKLSCNSAVVWYKYDANVWNCAAIATITSLSLEWCVVLRCIMSTGPERAMAAMVIYLLLRRSTTVRGVHKIIRLASRLAHTLGDHSIAAGLENLHCRDQKSN